MFFFSSRRRHTSCALVTGVQTCALPICFSGRPSTRVPAGATLISDAAELRVDAFDVIEVSVYLPGSVALNTIHGASGAKTLISAPGNFTQTPFTAVRTSDHRPLQIGRAHV